MFKMENVTGISPDPRSYQMSDLLPPGMVGVEIELEGFPVTPKFPSVYWSVKKDGSLRNGGREFVFTQPLYGVDIENALQDFKQFITDYQKKFGRILVTERCSVHCHVDVRDMTLLQNQMYIMIYLTFEKMLFKIFGPGRETNNHCIPLCESKAKRDLSMLDYRSVNNYSECIRGSKYAALNTNVVFNQGSFEFRLHRGTSDADEILVWVGVLLSMKKYAMTLDIEPNEYPIFISEKGIDIFLKEVFEDYLPQPYLGWQPDVMAGMRVAQDVIMRERIFQAQKKLTLDTPEMSELFRKTLKKRGI